ncbi:unnamed protein product [Brachionus calyciflorus]|uniref:Uncharacterized protein n=1 Tax=Brachionus calyciflorus TaxID=104777 RepID=A0A814F5F3_9BILA|nr:unnamed protein product [Brachionus calyciflorus]
MKFNYFIVNFIKIFVLVYSDFPCIEKNLSLNCQIDNNRIDQTFYNYIYNSQSDFINLDFKSQFYLEKDLLANKQSNKILSIKNLIGFQHDSTSPLVFLSLFKEVHIEHSVFIFYKNEFVINDDCSPNLTILNTISLFLHETVLFPFPVCPFLFFTMLRNFYLSKMTPNNSLQFKKINNLTNPDYKYVSKIIIEKSNIRLDSNLLNPTIFNEISQLEIRDSFVETIEDDLFTDNSDLNTFYIDNFSFLTKNNLNWMTNLSLKKSFNEFDNCYQMIYDLSRYNYRVKRLYLILNESLNNYDYPEKDFCLFGNFPHKNLVFPIIHTKRPLNCSCTVIWLLLNWKILDQFNYFKEVQMNTSSVSKCFVNIDQSIQKCNFPRRLKLCGLKRDINKFHFKCDLKKRYYQKGCFEKMIIVYSFFFIGAFGILLKVLSLVILKDRVFKENMFKFMKIEIWFEILSLSTLFFNATINYSIDLFVSMNIPSCDLDYRSTNLYLTILKIYPINFITFTSITCATISNMIMVFDRYLYICNNDLLINSMLKILEKDNFGTERDLENLSDLKIFFERVVVDLDGAYSLNEYSRIQKIWERDTRDIKSTVLNSFNFPTSSLKNGLSPCKIKSINREHSFFKTSYFFEFDLWRELCQNKICSNKRFKLSINGIFLLNEALQSKEFNCWIRESFNYFKSESSKKINAPFWNGEFICLEKECRELYKLSILNEPEQGKNFEIIMIAKNQDVNSLHQNKIKPKLKFYGETRLRTNLDIVVNGTQNVLAKVNNGIEEELNGKYENVHAAVLRKIKSEHKNKEVLSKDLLYDTLATKNMVHGFNLSEKKPSKLNDYIQNICADPYVDENIGIISYEHRLNDTDNTGTIKNDSEYGKYFTSYKKKILEEIKSYDHEAESTTKVTELNEFYCPSLVEIIDNYMHILPLWTGICLTNLKYPKMSPYYEKEITRLTNNGVENWFKILKNDILQKNKFVKPSILIGRHAPYMQSVLNKVVDKKEISKYLIIEETSLDACTEWFDKKNSKSSYHDSINIKKLKKNESLNSSIKESHNENIESKKSTHIEAHKIEKFQRFNLRTFTQHMPSWGGSFYDQNKMQKIVLINTCTIDNFLMGFWVSTKLSKNLTDQLLQNSENNDTYKSIQMIVNAFNVKDWSRGK